MNTPAKKYDRFSKIYDLFESPMEMRAFSKYRKKALSLAKGKVLEIGIGTGKNLPYYPEGVEVIGIDFSRGMLEKAEKRKKELGLENVKLLYMDAQNMELDDNTFDTVVSTFVFCTVPDPIKGLKEAYRVLKPGGTAIFLEHMKSNLRLLNIPLYLMEPFIKTLLGTSMLRETQKNIEKAGFKIEKVENLFFNIVRLIIATKPTDE
ncbi:MAG: methyltransferase domain-containing protein [Thermococcus sp.]|uniref:class I SAM-dependent methyltransferase n=1 Tax=Thermococcus sp. TaxID=35749 RepID=UPI0026331A35|nr:methyltransferase domain-containing protein [Thermococcus sp.]MCD6139648.1 methyltransferase domain-containing protein [Thermococcus sp.]MCD6144331.1 methyltransferase domain-containing protein [Thermococcus sp.]